jgi:transposase
MRSCIEPMKKIVGMLRSHRDLIQNYFKARKVICSGTIERLKQQSESHDEKILCISNLSRNKTGSLSLAWKLPEPELTHKFY